MDKKYNTASRKGFGSCVLSVTSAPLLGLCCSWTVCGTAVRTSSCHQTGRGLRRCQAGSCLKITSGSRAKTGDASSTSWLGHWCHMQHGWVARDGSTKITTAAALYCSSRIKPPGGTKDLKTTFSRSEDPHQCSGHIRAQYLCGVVWSPLSKTPQPTGSGTSQHNRRGSQKTFKFYFLL